MTNTHDRYHRQTLLPGFGDESAKALEAATVTLVGCGALGTAIAEILVRAGVGALRIVDRDFVEESNLQRQILFDEDDARESLPKAIAAKRKLVRINSSVRINAEVADVTPKNIEPLIDGVQLVLDGTDNAETRFLINDACVKHRIPWIYGGAVGTQGLVATIRPGVGPCLRCFLPDTPPAGSLPTCDTAGVLAPAPLTVASLQATAALKLLLGIDTPVGALTQVDVWRPKMTTIHVARDDQCPACGEGRFEFLDAALTAWATTLCGRNAVQITPPGDNRLDLQSLGDTISRSTPTHFNGILLTIDADPFEIIVFPDGRCIIKGTTDEGTARGVYAKYLGG